MQITALRSFARARSTASLRSVPQGRLYGVGISIQHPRLAGAGSAVQPRNSFWLTPDGGRADPSDPPGCSGDLSPEAVCCLVVRRVSAGPQDDTSQGEAVW